MAKKTQETIAVKKIYTSEGVVEPGEKLPKLKADELKEIKALGGCKTILLEDQQEDSQLNPAEEEE